MVLAVQPRECRQEDLTEEQVDSFCALYTKVLEEPGDEVIVAKVRVKKNLLVNERLYRKVCLKQT